MTPASRPAAAGSGRGGRAPRSTRRTTEHALARGGTFLTRRRTTLPARDADRPSIGVRRLPRALPRSLEDSMRRAVDARLNRNRLDHPVLSMRSIGARGREAIRQMTRNSRAIYRQLDCSTMRRYGRADEAGLRSRKSRRWPWTRRLHKVARGRWASRTSIQSNCAAIADARRAKRRYFIARQDIDA